MRITHAKDPIDGTAVTCNAVYCTMKSLELYIRGAEVSRYCWDDKAANTLSAH